MREGGSSGAGLEKVRSRRTSPITVIRRRTKQSSKEDCVMGQRNYERSRIRKSAAPQGLAHNGNQTKDEFTFIK